MTRRTWTLGVLAATAVALAVSAFLYDRSQSADFEDSVLLIADIRQAQHEDAALKRDVLAVRYGLSRQYDDLAARGRDIQRMAGEIRARATRLSGGTAQELNEALDGLDASVRDRQSEVERFKAENAVLHNSLLYLPLAADRLAVRLRQSTSPDRREISESLQGLVSHVLSYNLVRGAESLARAERGIVSLREALGSAPAELRPELTSVLAHASTATSRQQVVDPLVRGLLQDDIQRALNRIDEAYGAHFRSREVVASRYQQLLYGWSVLLVLVVAAAGWALFRSWGRLEHLVEKRTRDLNLALDQLWGEMNLAKKIQVALVPNQPELRHADVSAVMRPADDVGGDYYDVVRAKDGSDWILIGDVSGHGVPAGLVMMMCQTAVHTVLDNQPDVSPASLVTQVNRALTQNIKRLGEDKYMTFTAIRHDSEGISFAGLHQDLMVYRQATKTVEMVETDGMWLGMREEIYELCPEGRLALDAGDVLLLYTDGVTEATLEDGSLLDQKGLGERFGALAERKPAAIVRGLVKELDRLEVRDDVALVAIRHTAGKNVRAA